MRGISSAGRQAQRGERLQPRNTQNLPMPAMGVTAPSFSRWAFVSLPCFAVPDHDPNIAAHVGTTASPWPPRRNMHLTLRTNPEFGPAPRFSGRFLDAAELPEGRRPGPLVSLRDGVVFAAYNTYTSVEPLRKLAGANADTGYNPRVK